MNWYKKSTRSPKLSDDIYPQIDQIVEKIVLFFRSNEKAPSKFLRVGTITSHNHHYNVNVKSEIYLTNKYVEEEATGGYRDRITGNIFLNILQKGFKYKSWTKDQKIREIYKTFLEHELTHSSDIKINDKKLISYFNYFDHMEETRRPTELDAYSKNIVEEIKRFYNKSEENKELVKKILASDNIMDLRNKNIISYNLFEIFVFWYKNKPTYFRTLLKRIYNEVINENSYG